MKHEQQRAIRPIAKMAGTTIDSPRSALVAWLGIGSGAFLSLLVTGVSEAATFVVEPDGSGDQPTIQAAVDEAVDGDVVELADGVFRGPGNFDVNLQGKGILVRSQSGNPSSSRIDCEGTADDPHRAFLFVTDETSSTALQGLGIENGFAPAGEDGGAVLCLGTAPSFVDCAFENCTALDTRGGAVSVSGGSPRFEECSFSACTSRQGGALSIEVGSPAISSCEFFDNRSDFDGGAIYALECASVLDACTFARNTSTFGGAMFFDNDATPSIMGSVFHDNSSELVGGAICFSDANALIESCTFSDNAGFSWDFEGGAAFWCSFGSSITANNTVFAFGGFGRAIACEEGANATLTCCDVFGNEGGDWIGCIEGQDAVRGNLSEDPLFCDRSNRDYQVAGNSPCLPDQNECGSLIGALGEGCNPVAVIGTSWGAIKAQFRSE